MILRLNQLVGHKTRRVPWSPTCHWFILYYSINYLLFLHAWTVDRTANIVCNVSLQKWSEFLRRWREEVSHCTFLSPCLSQGVFVVPAALQVLLRRVAWDDVWRRDRRGRFHLLGWKWFGRKVRRKTATVVGKNGNWRHTPCFFFSSLISLMWYQYLEQRVPKCDSACIK